MLVTKEIDLFSEVAVVNVVQFELVEIFCRKVWSDFRPRAVLECQLLPEVRKSSVEECTLTRFLYIFPSVSFPGNVLYKEQIHEIHSNTIHFYDLEF